MKYIDLNADLGEGQAFDVELMDIISSASVACGGHAGDRNIIKATLKHAKRAGVVTGAHPGFLDKQNFGRVRLEIAPEKISEQVIVQLHRIFQIAREVDQPISYVKLHGALYNWASRDEKLARTLFAAIKKFDPSLKIMALSNSAQISAAKSLGMNYISEAFADRAYDRDGFLVSRNESGSVFEAPQMAVNQAMTIARDGEIAAQDGSVLSTDARSICLHGDNAAALELAKAVRSGLCEAGIDIRAPD